MLTQDSTRIPDAVQRAALRPGYIVSAPPPRRAA